MARVRSLVSDCEALREKNEATTKELEAMRKLFEEKIAAVQAELARVVQERDDLASEISQEREVVVSANKLADDFKKKLEIASTALVERQSEVATLHQEKANLEGLINKSKADLAALHEVHAAEVKRMNADISLRNDTIDKLSREAEAMQVKIAAKEHECNGYVKEVVFCVSIVLQMCFVQDFELDCFVIRLACFACSLEGTFRYWLIGQSLHK
ncbi:hypothetical protein OSTOST_09615 [Ostertagia ostertagi]